MYVLAFKQATAPAQHGSRDIIDLLADLHAAIPQASAEPAVALLESIHYAALAHACLCVLAAQLVCPAQHQQLRDNILSSDTESAASLQAILSASPHHQQLLLTAVSKAKPDDPDALKQMLHRPTAGLLGPWVAQWQHALR